MTEDREQPQHEMLAILRATGRKQLEELIRPFGLTVRGFGDTDVYVLAAKNLRSADELPAMLRLRRGGALEADISDRTYVLELSWLGERPELDEDTIAAFAHLVTQD